MTDFRALCAELVENLERYQCWYIEDNGYGIDDLEALLRRADTALAQPEPQMETVAWCSSDDFNDAAKKRQSFSGWREQHPDCDLALCVFPVTAQPEPQGPSDEAIMRLACISLGYEYTPSLISNPENDIGALEAFPSELLAFARAVLARWGRPTSTENFND